MHTTVVAPNRGARPVRARTGSGFRAAAAQLLTVWASAAALDAELARTPAARRGVVAREWAALFGTDLGAVHVTQQEPGVRRIDARLTAADAPGGARELMPLRILRLPEQVDPFPAPGGMDALARAASEKRPHFFDGPGAAWDFFEQWRPPAEPRRANP